MLNDKEKAVLAESGFEKSSYGWMSGEIYRYRTKMTVDGEHSTDYLDILYVRNKELNGLCYSSSLWEYMLSSYEGLDEDKIEAEIHKYLQISVEFKSISDGVFIYKKCTPETTESLWKKTEELIKGAVLLDYFLTSEKDRIDRIEHPEWYEDEK